MSSGTNRERIIINNEIINNNNLDLDSIKEIIDNLPSSTDTTATASDILVGKTAISQGQLITGNMTIESFDEYVQCLNTANAILGIS